jgi:hypothetical protein
VFALILACSKASTRPKRKTGTDWKKVLAKLWGRTKIMRRPMQVVG